MSQISLYRNQCWKKVIFIVCYGMQTTVSLCITAWLTPESHHSGLTDNILWMVDLIMLYHLTETVTSTSLTRASWHSGLNDNNFSIYSHLTDVTMAWLVWLISFCSYWLDWHNTYFKQLNWYQLLCTIVNWEASCCNCLTGYCITEALLKDKQQHGSVA